MSRRSNFLALAIVLSGCRIVSGEAASLTYLYNFKGGPSGGNPLGSLAADAAGNLFGVGWILSQTFVFELSPPKSASTKWAYKVLHWFPLSDGYGPTPDLSLDPSGNVYGLHGETLFQIARPSQSTPSWQYHELATLYFGDGLVGPIAVSTVGGISISIAGGASAPNVTYGDLIQVSASSPAGPWTSGVLSRLQISPAPNAPDSGLIADQVGDLFFETVYGGNGQCTYDGVPIGCGTVSRYSPSKNLVEVLYGFQADEQNHPAGVLTRAHMGGLFGAVGYDVIQIDAAQAGHAERRKQTIFEFPIPGHMVPDEGVIEDGNGNLYGTASPDGNFTGSGGGFVYKLTPPTIAGRPWTEKVLATLGSTAPGNEPSGLLLFRDGKLFGTLGGFLPSSYGAIFALNIDK